MTPSQKKEVQIRLKRELFRQGIRHPRVPLKSIDAMKLENVTEKFSFYAKIEKVSFYAWISNENGEVLAVQVMKRH